MSLEIKAFVVSSEHSEASVLTFATSQGQAKSLAQHSMFLEDSEFKDLRVKREPRADGKMAGMGTVECVTPEECRLLRELGWYQIEGHSEPCEACQLYQWDNVPESLLSDPGPKERTLCAGCRAKGQNLVNP